MKPIQLTMILVLWATVQALGGQEIIPELMLHGDNNAAIVLGGFPEAYDTSGASTVDGSVVCFGDILNWAVNITVNGTEGDVNSGAADFAIHLQLTHNGVPVNIGGVADGCTGGTGGFCSTMNDGSAGSPAGFGHPQLASFALSVDARSFAELFGAVDPLPYPLSGSIIDVVADDGANMDLYAYPSAQGFPIGATTPAGSLAGMRAAYSSFTTPSDNQLMDDGNMAGVGCVGTPGITTCGSGFEVSVSNGPFFEGQINTFGLPYGTNTLTVTIDAESKVLDGTFEPLGGEGTISNYAQPATLTGSDSITFDVIACDCFCWITYAASRKDHVGGTTSTYDIDLLNPTNHLGNPVPIGVESRGKGVIDRLVLGFEAPVSLSCADITILQGAHSCTDVTDLGGGYYEVRLSGGVSNSYLELQLTGLDGDIIKALNTPADTTADGIVTCEDASAIPLYCIPGGCQVTEATARLDVNLDNSLTPIDLFHIKGWGAQPCRYLTGAVSRKTHGSGVSAVDYDVELYPGHSGTGGFGVECRTGGLDRLILTFSDRVVLDCSHIQLNEGGASCVATTDLGNATTWEVALAGSMNRTCLELELVSSDLSGDLVIRGLNLAGDVNASGGVTIADISAIKADITGGTQGAVTPDNFRSDVNLSGGLTIGDMSVVKNHLSESASCPE